MKRKKLLTTLALGIALIPFYASAESATTTPSPTQPATEAQVFTACSQATIEVRDNSIGSARTIYNAAMAAALSARKEDEKNAIAIEDPSDKKDAIRRAVDQYRKAVTAAQDGLTKARKEAWSTFEANANKCRDVSKEARKNSAAERKATTTEKTSELKTSTADTEEVKAETKSFGESIFESLKNFFKKGGAATTTDQ